MSRRLILEVEKFKANSATPKGKQNDKIIDLMPEQAGANLEFDLEHFKQMQNSNLEFRRFFDNDNDFFHVTCHLDLQLKQKIRRGEFVELERLLPQERNSFNWLLTDEKKMEWVTKDGQTYLTAVQSKESKITRIRKWEQAFWIYAAVYTDANPERASEIW